MSLYRWHAWTGLISGLFLIVICTSGTVAVFRPEIERRLDWGDYSFDVKKVGEPVTVEGAIATALKAYPGRAASQVRLPAQPGSWFSHGDTYCVTLEGGRGKPVMSVLVDPYKDAVVASARPNSGWGDVVRQLHLRFYYGSFWGRCIVGVFGITLLFSTVSGVWIYRKFNAGRWWTRVRWGRGGRIVMGDLHKVVGLASVGFNVLFGLTGGVLGLEGVYFKFLQEKPARVAKLEPVRTLADGALERFTAKAEELIPGSHATAIGLSYRKNGLAKISVSHPTSSLVMEEASYVVLNAATGEAVEVHDATKAGLGVRAYYAVEPLHYGRLGGYLWVKLLWGGMGLTGGFLSVTGFVIYVMRKRTARRNRKALRVASAAVEMTND